MDGGPGIGLVAFGLVSAVDYLEPSESTVAHESSPSEPCIGSVVAVSLLVAVVECTDLVAFDLGSAADCSELFELTVALESSFSKPWTGLADAVS